MVAIETLEDIGMPDKPRRIMKYVLVYCTSGTLTLVIDANEYHLKAGEVITITSGQFHAFGRSKAAKGYRLEFTMGFFCKDDKDIELIFHNGLFCHFAMNEVIPADKRIMVTELAAIQQELKEKPYQYLISIRNHIALMLVAINRAKLKRGDEIWKPDALFLKFLELVRNNFEHNHPLSFFAKQLCTTVLKLNEQARLHTGKTAQQVISGLVTSEGKRLLLYEDLTIKEIAFRLGFNDPFYFSNFFKKQTGISPKQYKEEHNL